MANNKNEKTVQNNNKLNQDNKEEKNQLGKKYKLIATWIICFCSFIYGLTSYIIGPALNDMKIKLNVSTDSITIVFGCMLIGYTIGAVVNGIIFNYINRQLVLTLLLILMGLTITAAPFCPGLVLLFTDAALCGFGAGGVDTAQVVWIIEMWAEKSSIYLSGYQCFFAWGTFISPLLSRPYLAEEILVKPSNNNTTFATTSTISTAAYTTSASLLSNITVSTQETDIKSYTNSRIEIPFGIVGGLLVMAGLLILVLHFFRRYVPPLQKDDNFVCKCPQKWKLIYISLGVLTLAPYVGMEMMNFNLIATFAKSSHLKLTPAESADIQTYISGAFALFRTIVFFVSFKFWSEKTLYFNFITIFVGNTLLFLYEFNNYSKTFLVVGVIISGSGFSSVFPSTYAFLENQFTVSNTIGGIFVCLSGLMGAILPTLCGQFIEGEPLILVYINYSCLAIISIAFILFNFIIYIRKSKPVNQISE